MYTTQEAMKRFSLREKGMLPTGAEPQSYALGVKEVWLILCECAHLCVNVRLYVFVCALGVKEVWLILCECARLCVNVRLFVCERARA
jgi:hypothetical protein